MHGLDVAKYKLKKTLHQFPSVVEVDLLKFICLIQGGTAICLEAEVCSTRGLEEDVEISLPAARVSNLWEPGFTIIFTRLVCMSAAPERCHSPGVDASCESSESLFFRKISKPLY